jgi:uncharacterized membrane protein YeaQ/YmgE (transglycosylase-associated protein family)
LEGIDDVLNSLMDFAGIDHHNFTQSTIAGVQAGAIAEAINNVDNQANEVLNSLSGAVVSAIAGAIAGAIDNKDIKLLTMALTSKEGKVS